MQAVEESCHGKVSFTRGELGGEEAELVWKFQGGKEQSLESCRERQREGGNHSSASREEFRKRFHFSAIDPDSDVSPRSCLISY